jgi:hypothetical protein
MIIDTPTGTRVTGFYRGKVVEHGENGKCKIFIPGVFPDSWLEEKNNYKLPYAEQANSIGFDNNRDNGFFTYPDINSIVWCFFANEDQNHPVYFATCQGGTLGYNTIYNSENKKTPIQKNYINFGNLRIDFIKNDVYSSDPKTEPKLISSNPSIKISTQYKSEDGSLNKSNAFIEIDSIGNINFFTTENISISGNDILISSTGNMVIDSTKQISITSNENVLIKSRLGSIITNAISGFVAMLTRWTKDDEGNQSIKLN